MATNKFSEMNMIGNGASVIVYKGVLKDGTTAAIKMLRTNRRSAERAFRLEVRHLFQLDLSVSNNFCSTKYFFHFLF